MKRRILVSLATCVAVSAVSIITLAPSATAASYNCPSNTLCLYQWFDGQGVRVTIPTSVIVPTVAGSTTALSVKSTCVSLTKPQLNNRVSSVFNNTPYDFTAYDRADCNHGGWGNSSTIFKHSKGNMNDYWQVRISSFSKNPLVVRT
jgi:hypothetical protein